MGISLDGLVSGLSTAQLIKSLMDVEAIPQRLLQLKANSTQNYVNALKSLNAQVATLAGLGKAANASGALDLYAAKTSDPTMTVVVGPGASATQLDITVDKVAQAQQLVTDSMISWPADALTLTVVSADGTKTEITAQSTSLSDVASAINASGSGVQATRVSAGTDAVTGEPLYRLQLSSSAAGTAGSFSIFNGTAADVEANTAPALAATQIRAAQDAEVTLWKGTAAEQKVVSSTNTFTDITPGVSVTVSAVSTDAITISVARDDAGITKVAEDLIASLNSIFGSIAAQRVVKTSIGSDGKSVVTAGIFSSDSIVRDAEQRLITAASAPIDGRSPSEFGMSITDKGTIEFDAKKFNAALAKDPTATMAALTTVSTRLEEAANVLSDKYDGSLTAKINGQTSLVGNITQQVADWDRRLASRQSTLERTYAALEVQLSKLNSQSSWISAQLGGLNAGNS